MKKIFDFLKFSFAFIISKLFFISKRNENIWIITERRYECKDNGYYLFKFLRTNCPEVKAYYAIDKKSEQVDKIKYLGNVIYFNSIKHYVYSLVASHLIGAFLPCGIPDSMCFYRFSKLVKGKTIFLQHGITIGKIDSLQQRNTKLDLFICGAKPEYDFVLNNFGYNEEQVQYTGFCRFDGLSRCRLKKQILIMPTWRQWIPSKTWHTDYVVNLDDIDYFVNYKSLIANKSLITFFKQRGYQFIFFLHHEMQPYINYFDDCKDIIIASEKDYDVQDLLKSSQVLITDYSSVAFDFAYMKKPIVYYQFDEDEYYKNHYQKGYFDYETMGFGKKCLTENEVVAELIRIANNGFSIDDKFEDRVNAFFKFRDNNNCRRVYSTIRGL